MKCRNTRSLVFAVLSLLWLAALAGCSQPVQPENSLDAELARIYSLLPGYFKVDTVHPLQKDKAITLHHKIVPIKAPQFGQRVFYHQVSAGGFDAIPMQQKIYVFDLTPNRPRNRMSSYVFAPNQGYANLERDTQALRSLQPDQLMNFPDACRLNWRSSESVIIAAVRATDCSYKSQAFGGLISPDMSYAISADSFTLDETLFDGHGKALVSTGGPLTARRVK